jgi:hypothetical protein
MLGRTEPTRTQRQQIIPGYSLGGPVVLLGDSLNRFLSTG